MSPALQILSTMIKEECLSKIIPISERHLRNAIEAFTAHYHLERNHQGLGNQLIEGHAESEPVFDDAMNDWAVSSARITVPLDRLLICTTKATPSSFVFAAHPANVVLQIVFASHPETQICFLI